MSQERDQLDDHMSDAEAKLFARLADFVDDHGDEAERAEVKRLIRVNPVAAKMAKEIREDSTRVREVLDWTLPWHSVEPPKRDPETRKKVEALKALVAREEAKRFTQRRLRMGVVGLAAAAAVVGFLVLRPAPIVGEACPVGQSMAAQEEAKSFVVRANHTVKTNATTRIEVKLYDGSVVTLNPSASVTFDTGVVTVEYGDLHGTAGPSGLHLRLATGLIGVLGNQRFHLQYDETGAIFKSYGVDARFSGKDGERLLPAGKAVRIERDGSIIERPP